MKLRGLFKRQKPEVVVPKAEPKKEGKGRRQMYIGQASHLLNDWVTSPVSADREISTNLLLMRARSRQLVATNDYAKRFIAVLLRNVIGPNGIRLQVKERNSNGNPDNEFNKSLELAWDNAGKKKNYCTVDKRLSRFDAARLILRTIAVDGEAIVHKRPGFRKNRSRFSIKLLDPDLLDWSLNLDKLSNGNRVRMGVEFNSDDEPIAYYFIDPTGDYKFNSNTYQHKRILAKHIEHIFIQERTGQSRGIPWIATPAARMHMLKGFEEAVVIGARVGASKLGFFKPNDEQGYNGDGKDAEGYTMTSAEPGTFEELPKGLEVEEFNPDYPPANFEEFMMTMLRGISSGLDISYVTLANDLKGVSYSSIRQGVLEDRDTYRVLQRFIIEHFYEPIFESWLQCVDPQEIGCDPRRLFGELNVKWQSRGWEWVDPLKDVKANVEAINNKLKTRAEVIASSGGDIDEVFEQLEYEEALGQSHKLDLSNEEENKQQSTAQDSADQSGKG